MKVMVMVKASRSSEAGEMPGERLLTEMGQFNEELVKAGIMLAGEGLHPTSKGVRVRFSGKNRTVTHGPFAETNELVAGFWLWKVASMEEAIDWARRCPNPHEDDSDIEIRPLFEAEDFGDTFTPELREQEASLRAQTLGLGAPRFEDLPECLVAGLNDSYTFASRMDIPRQWERFAPYIGKVNGQLGDTAYGVCWNYVADRGFDYLSGVEIAGTDDLPEEFVHLRLPGQRYVVFTHQGHVSTISETIEKIWQRWSPDCGLRIADSPCFERYSRDFCPTTGMGGMEICIPLAG